MPRAKMTPTAFCLFLLIGHHVGAVVNKASSQAATKEDEKKEIKAENRISNFEHPAIEYGPPSGSSFNGPAPVYGPPELVGHGPVSIYPPPPPDVPPPPPVYGVPSFGPPRSIKPVYGPPKQSYGPPLKPGFGKFHFGPIKQHLGPPPLSFGSFKPPKPGPPLNFNGGGHQHVSISISNQYGPPKSGHGPHIPLALDIPALPNKSPAVPFNSIPSDHGSHLSADALFGPPPPGPPPGVPAPPTPPDIKYDGWQPIAGLTSSPNQHGPSDAYGVPKNGGYNGGSSSSSYSHSSHSAGSSDKNVPSDSYGVPIHNPEAQNLQSSVHESSASSESNGLPPPPLPQYEPYHTESEAAKTSSLGGHKQKPSSEYGTPNGETLSIIKTIGYELPPTTGSLSTDLQGLSLSAGSSSSSLDLSHALNSGSSISSLDLTGGLHDFSLNAGTFGHGLQHIGDELSLQHLPLHIPFETYGPPLSVGAFGKPGASLPSISLPPGDSYGAPPLSSYSPNGPYPAAQTPRGAGYAPIGLFSTSFHKYTSHHHRPHGGFRPPPPPPSSLIPPRNREPIKFREPIPTGLLSTINRLPSLRPIDLKAAKSQFPILSLGQQLPSLTAPISFHQSTGIGNSLPISFSSSSFGKGNSNAVHSPIAAPHVQYGTPLSFTDFNTPAPVLTYGAPNFGPATSFASSSIGVGTNLYDGVSNTLTTTYGTPVINAQISTGGGHDCGFPQSHEGLSLRNTGSHESTRSFASALSASSGDSHGYSTASANLQKSAGSSYTAPSVSELDLDHYEQQKTDLKDSYGNPIEGNFDTSIQTSTEIPLEGRPNEHVAPPPLTSQSNGVEFVQSKSYGKSLSSSNDMDANQFLKTDEGSHALALAQGLTGNGIDGFQIQGSKGTYMLQIQPANGGYGTENSDGGIRHDQVLSNGLLQDILAAIEQPEHGSVQIQGPPQAQPLQEVYNNVQQISHGQISDSGYNGLSSLDKVFAEQLQSETQQQVQSLQSTGDTISNLSQESLESVLSKFPQLDLQAPVEEVVGNLSQGPLEAPPAGANDNQPQIHSEGQSFKEYNDLSEAASDATKGHYIKVENSEKSANGKKVSDSKTSSSDIINSAKSGRVALFFNNRYRDTRKDTRSLSRSEQQATTSATTETQDSHGKAKTS